MVLFSAQMIVAVIVALFPASGAISKCGSIKESFLDANYDFDLKNFVSCIESRKIGVDLSNRLEWRPLHLTANFGDLEGSSKLLQFGADPAPQNMRASTPLHIAAFQNYNGIVKLLAQNKDTLNKVDFLGNSALHLAVQNKQKETMNILLDAGADPYLVNQRALSPISLSCTLKDREVIKVFNLNENICSRDE
ncbi:receptor-interacting serine/threonine-protein kinase 4-like [Symsagittifera roscoffensis]|uniref:receptor-interacting serine/threonine-protein kinase 4-like n=1 Tax=Symsagittifera roscoffensis TaxID=84072 RepID=UPI00307CAC65